MSQPPSPCGRIALAAALLAIGATAISAALSAARTLQQPHYPVAGRVLVDGLPPAGAIVTLHPHTSLGWPYVPPAGVVDRNGTFHVKSFGVVTGAPQGDYRVTIAWSPMIIGVEGFEQSDNVVPAMYCDPHTTPFIARVNTRATHWGLFDIPTSQGSMRRLNIHSHWSE